jgi:hypothetical protein
MAWVYDIKRNVKYEESQEQENERVRKARVGMRIAEEKAQKIEADKERRGYCAKCKCLMPLSGVCDICHGTKKMPPPRLDTIDHKRGLVKGGYVNPTILKMYDK